MKYFGWFALYLSLAFALLLPLSAHPGSRLPDDGDAILTVWTLWWSATHLSAGYPEIFDANTFYPHPQGLLYSEPLLGQGLVAWPLFLISDNPVFATNVLMILTLALSALAAQLLFRELTGSTVGAVVGAIAYTFSAYSFSQLARIQLITLQWLPLALWCLHRYFTREKKGYLVGFAIFSTLQGLSCLYYLAFYVVGLGVLFPAYFWAYPAHRTARSLTWVGVSGLSIGGALALVTIPFLLLSRHYAFKGEPESYDLVGYLLPRSQNLLYRALDLHPMLVDHFVGYFVLLIALIGLIALTRKPRGEERAIGLAYLGVAALGFLLSAGPELSFAGIKLGAGPFALLQQLGPYQNLRAPDRFSLLVTLGVGVLVAYGVSQLLARRSRGVTVFGCALISTIVLAEHWSPLRIQGVAIPAGDNVPDVYPWLAETPDEGAVVELPLYPRERNRFFALYMFFSTYHKKPILFGRTSFYPPSVDHLAWQLRSFPDRDSIDLLRSQGVKTVVIHPGVWEEPERGERLAQLKTFAGLQLSAIFPPLVGPQYKRFGLGGERVYRLEGEASPHPAQELCTPKDEIAPDNWTLKGSGEVPESLAIDRDSETAWKTDGQLPDDYLLIDLGREETVAAAKLTFGYPYNEFPRHLVLRSGVEGEPFETVRYRDDLPTKFEMLESLRRKPQDAAITLRFEPRQARRLRMRVGGQEYDYSLPDWQLRELFLYKSCEAQSLRRAKED